MFYYLAPILRWWLNTYPFVQFVVVSIYVELDEYHDFNLGVVITPRVESIIFWVWTILKSSGIDIKILIEIGSAV